MATVSLVSGVTDQLKGLLRNQGITIFNGILIIVTISGEQVFRRLSFKCPCVYPQNIVYGGAFIFAPAISLFMIGFLINGTTWRIVHGCCYRVSRTRHGMRRGCYYWFMIIAQASVAPVAWLFVAFLQGDYYECLRAGDYCRLSPANCTDMKSDISKKEPAMAFIISETMGYCVDPLCVCDLKTHRDYSSRYLISFSQLIAWLLLLTTLAIVLLTVWNRAEKLAIKNVTAFFNKPNRTKLDWDKISVVPLSEYPHYLDFDQFAQRTDPYFSPLHEWAKDHRRVGEKWLNVVKTASTENLRLASSDPQHLNRKNNNDHFTAIRIETVPLVSEKPALHQD